MREQYTYDHKNLRIKKEEYIGNNVKKTYYVYNGNNILFTETYINTTPIEMRFNLSDMASYTYHYGTDAKEELNYYYKDHLQSRVVKTEADGSIVSSANKFDYSSWGELDNEEATEESWFTGKKQDDSGLYYFNARYYDPIIGRFISQDPAAKGLNWYTYCNNNPINRFDPTGLDDDGEGVEESTGSGILDEAKRKVETNGNISPDDKNYKDFSKEEVDALRASGYDFIETEGKIYVATPSTPYTGFMLEHGSGMYKLWNITPPKLAPESTSEDSQNKPASSPLGETAATITAAASAGTSGLAAEVIARSFLGNGWSLFAGVGGGGLFGFSGWARAGVTFNPIDSVNFSLDITAQGKASTSSGLSGSVVVEGTFKDVFGLPFDITASLTAGAGSSSGFGVVPGLTATFPLGGIGFLK